MNKKLLIGGLVALLVPVIILTGCSSSVPSVKAMADGDHH